VRFIVMVERNSEPWALVLPNWGKPVRRKSCDPAVKLGQIGIDGIIGIRMERLFGQGNLRLRVVYFKLSRWRVGPGRDLGFDKPQAKVLQNHQS